MRSLRIGLDGPIVSRDEPLAIWPDGTRVELVADGPTERRLDGDPLRPGTAGEVVRGDMLGGRYVQVRFDGEPVLRLVSRELLGPEKIVRK